MDNRSSLSNYKSSASSESSQEEVKNEEEEELENLFQLNEIQITTMLAKTVATEGEILPKEVQDELSLVK